MLHCRCTHKTLLMLINNVHLSFSVKMIFVLNITSSTMIYQRTSVVQIQILKKFIPNKI